MEATLYIFVFIILMANRSDSTLLLYFLYFFFPLKYLTESLNKIIVLCKADVPDYTVSTYSAVPDLHHQRFLFLPMLKVKRTNLKKPSSERTGHGLRVKFNPLALLLDASLEGEFDLVQRIIYEVKPNIILQLSVF